MAEAAHHPRRHPPPDGHRRPHPPPPHPHRPPVLPPELPQLAAAVEDGEVDDDHIKAVCDALDLLPNAVPATKKDPCEQILVRHAKSQDAKFVTSLGKESPSTSTPMDYSTTTTAAADAA